MIPAALPGVEKASAADSAPHDTGVGGPNSEIVSAGPNGGKSPVDFLRAARAGRSCCRSRNRRRAQRGDEPQDVAKQMARDGEFGHLERDGTAVTDDLRTDLAKFLPRYDRT